MAVINPQLIALARVQLQLEFVGEDEVLNASYVFSNGFDAVRVTGAKEWAPPIFVDNRVARGRTLVLFLSEPVQPGTASSPSEGGVKAIFEVVSVSTPINPLPVSTSINLAGSLAWQYGDYSLAGNGAPLVLPSTPYAKVDPMKALRFAAPKLGRLPGESVFVDVSVFQNPMTNYR